MKDHVIFFDIDGVLNTRRMWTRLYCFDLSKVRLLASFAARKEADLVMASSWRIGIDENDDSVPVIHAFHDCGISHIYQTPVGRDRARDKEIRVFLRRHPEIAYCCILDDDANEYKTSVNGLCLVDCDHGLTEKDLRKVRFVRADSV